MDFTCAPHAVGNITSNTHTRGFSHAKCQLSDTGGKRMIATDRRGMGEEVGVHMMGKELQILFFIFSLAGRLSEWCSQ